MALVRPKTIVITTMSSKTAHIPGTINIASRHSHQESLLDPGGARKRRRLTHLSPEEKMLRRKLKNRVAAQTARDRKKAKMTELEEVVADLEDENKRLEKENCSLKQQKGVLFEENAQLKEKLGHTTDGVVVKKEQESTESAEGTDSCSFSIDDALRCFSSDAESDMLLGLLQQISEEANSSTAPQNITPSPTQSPTDLPRSTENVDPLVGPSTAELESLNELIKFDHIYYKAKAESQTRDLTQQASRSTLTAARSLSKNLASTSAKHDTKVQKVKKSSSIEGFSGLDFAQSLDQLDLESLLEQDSLDMEDAFHCDTEHLEVDSDPEPEPVPKRRRKSTLDGEVPIVLSPSEYTSIEEDDMQPLNLKTGPFHASCSESGYSSELSDVASPRSDSSSILGDDIWEESFTELFPALI